MEENPDLIDRDEIRQALDAEVKRISDLFRFVLKYKRQFQPSGVEFAGLRQYLPSDDASRIDWKNSAATPDLYVKEYDEDVDMDVFILVDCSDTMTFGTADKLKSEYSAVVAAAIAYASIDANINVGFCMYSEEEKMFVTPAGGTEQYDLIIDEITKPEHYGGKINMEDAIDDVIAQIKENTALFIISDFLDTEGEWKSKLALSSRKFRHVMSVVVRDLRDYKLPESGNFRFESPDGSQQMVVNTSSVREQFNEQAKRDEEALEEKIKGGGSAFIKLDTRDKFSARFAEYFDDNNEEW